MNNSKKTVVDVQGLTTKNKDFTNVVIVKNGVISVTENVSPAKSYHIIDDFSVRIHNGHLHTPKDQFVCSINNCTNLMVNLSRDHKTYVIVSKNLYGVLDYVSSKIIKEQYNENCN